MFGKKSLLLIIITGVIISILLLSPWNLLINIDKENKSELDPELLEYEDELLVMAAREGFFGGNYRWTYIFRNRTAIEIITNGGSQNDTSLSQDVYNYAISLLSLANYSHNNMVPTSISYFEINESYYEDIIEKVINVDFKKITHEPPTASSTDIGYYQVVIYIIGYEDSIRFYKDEHPNEETLDLAKAVLNSK